MRLLAIRRVNLLQVSQEQSSKVDERLGHGMVALEIECSLLEAVVLTRMAEDGYINLLGCPIP